MRLKGETNTFSETVQRGKPISSEDFHFKEKEQFSGSFQGEPAFRKTVQGEIKLRLFR